MPVDPHSNEIRYSMSLVGLEVAALAPRTVRIASHSPELVRAVVRYLACGGYRLIVDTPELQLAVAETLGVAVEVRDGQDPPADCAVLPLGLDEGSRAAGEAAIVVVCHNAISYKSLLRPRAVRGTVTGTMRRLRAHYEVRVVGGLFSPRFIALLALAKVTERWIPALHFRLEGLAMTRLVELGPLWRLSYVVVLGGRRHG
jgi:hypothetical protein